MESPDCSPHVGSMSSADISVMLISSDGTSLENMFMIGMSSQNLAECRSIGHRTYFNIFKL